MSKNLDITKINFDKLYDNNMNNIQENILIKNKDLINNKFSKIINNLYYIFEYLPRGNEKYIIDKYFIEFKNYEYINYIFNYIFSMFYWRDIENEKKLTKADLTFIFEVKEKQFNLSGDEIDFFEKILDKAIIEIRNLIRNYIIKDIIGFFMIYIKNNKIKEIKEKINFDTKNYRIIKYIINMIDWRIDNEKKINKIDIEFIFSVKINKYKLNFEDLNHIYEIMKKF
jgi:hypothetical protein